MRLLHLGSGFRPMRKGGLVAYIEDLMEEQVRRGDEVTYLFSGRHYPFIGGPRLRRWERGGVRMLEIVNSPLYDHGRQPELELSEPSIELGLERLLSEIRPDVVHVQELAGLPSSVLEVARSAGTPTVVTLQDYFPLCSTFKLIDASGKVCLRREIGDDCVATISANPRPADHMFEATLQHDIGGLPLVRRIDPDRADRWIGRLSRRVTQRASASGPAQPRLAETFQRRRLTNVDRLNRADCVIAMSTRVAEIYREMGVDPSRMRALQLTLAHIERLRPRRKTGNSLLTFATLAGFESLPKGAELLLEAARQLSEKDRRFRLLVYGHVHAPFQAAAERIDGIEVRGTYRLAQLDGILDEVDVGIVPSIWEEAYGYAGMEFLAKGIPVIANAIGGMTDYTRAGETGWLNHSCSGEELAKIMDELIGRPQQVAELNAGILTSRESIVKPLARHAEEMDGIYRELAAARGD